MPTFLIKALIALSILLFFSACNDKSIVKIHNKKILEEKIKCMNLVVFPANEEIEKTFQGLYPFKRECALSLHISYKSAIVCNSTHNASQKAAGMPSGYLRLELKEGSTLFYSYYIDLNELLGEKQIKKAFSNLKEELRLQ